jgi:hypothetical protein
MLPAAVVAMGVQVRGAQGPVVPARAATSTRPQPGPGPLEGGVRFGAGQWRHTGQ